MKILIGVDTDTTYKAALRLCQRLRFPNPSWSLAHAVETTLTFAGFGPMVEAAHAVDFAKLAHDAGQRALDQAASDTKAEGIQADYLLLDGNAADSMMRFADEKGIDLIAVHSDRKGRLGSFFLGSVSRGLALCAKQSVLISKGDVAAENPVSAVFATDHSEYANKALGRLIEMAPAGLKNIHVLTSMHLSDAGPYFNIGEDAIPVEKQIVEKTGSKVREIVQRLGDAGYTATGQVYNLPVNEAIRRGMEDSGAELVIVGAQGHGFMHRLTLGSTALYQVVVEPHSVLLIRPAEFAK